MNVYVDPLKPSLVTRQWPYKWFCHLVVASAGELDAFAVDIGLYQNWRQDGATPHYDLTKKMRARAVAAGAVEISDEQMILKFRHERRKQRAR